MKNILLLEPPSNMHKLQKIKAKRPQIDAPLPLIYISTYLLKEGFDVEIIDMRISSMDELKKHLVDKKPVLAGISIMPGNILPKVIEVSGFIKRRSPGTKIVWGGSFASLHYELCLSAPEVDFVVCGDGEETLTELASALEKGVVSENLKNIKGLAFKEDGNIVSTGPRAPVDLDREPVGAWELVDKYMNNYLGVRGYININTARGCPHKCSFCYNNVLYKGFKRYRTKGVENVMKEIDCLMGKYGINKIKFVDDDFLGNKKRALELVSLLKNKYPHIKYHIDARADGLKDEGIIGHLAENGLESVFIGAETGSEEQIADIQKGISTNDIVEAARLCSKYDIEASYSFTCGYPGESYKDLYATIKMASLIRSMDKRNICAIEIISPIQGTPLYEELKDDNMIPEASLAKWCYLTDWKSARQKPWIKSGDFYEAFQLCFFLAFTHSRSHDSGLRLYTKLLSGWSRFRILEKRPKLLPEYRLANYIIKKFLWGF
jgi:radical SAM superfamily enzyme YgiQ (UPF0313 family)